MRHVFARNGVLISAVFFLFTAGPARSAERLVPVAPATADRAVEFDVYLPLQHADELDQLLEAQHTAGSPSYHQWLTPQQFRSRFGPKPDDIAKVTQALEAAGFTVSVPHSHGVHVVGTVDAVQGMFGVRLWTGRTASGLEKLIATEPMALPTALSEAGAQIVAFSPEIRYHVHSHVIGEVPDNRNSPHGGYWFTDLKQAYDFPSYQSLNGKGRTIAIVIASDFKDSDINAYFAHEKLFPPKAPRVLRRPVLGGAPFDPNSSNSIECELDIQQSGGMAPGATIIDYNVPDLSDAGVLAGYVSVLEDNRADIVNSSFGIFEANFIAAYNGGVDMTGILRVYEEVFKQGNSQGITFVASSGDFGGLNAPSVSYFTTPPRTPPVIAGILEAGINHPASSPYVTAVGGTNLITTFNRPSLESKYVSENAFGDPLIPFDPYGTGNLASGGFWGSGGGESIIFAKPGYQQLVSTGSNARTIPDISLQMGGCPGGIAKLPCGPDRSFVISVFNGKRIGLIGTSASSPEFAGLLAVKEEQLGGRRVGNENFDIYALSALQRIFPFLEFYHQDIPGFNGLFHTHHGYNLVLGNGTPLGRNFAFAPNDPPAGDPQTPSNP
ncbi:MAG: S8/S53 family peptidase [Acidobacteriaceae bacterium]|nr:S8/S53 family peptidase [Acidobacteriaceae bacterium]